MNFTQLDFRQLRIKHILYKSKVRSMLYGGSFDEEFFSTRGPVIEWIETVVVTKYGNGAQINEMIHLQQGLNELALELFDMYRSGQIEEARMGLKAVDQSSDRFLHIVDGLEKKYS